MAANLRAIRRSTPFVLIGLGLWLLAGCFYLPVPEHQFEKKKKVDFRPMLGQATSDQPLRPGITRAQVVSLLGAPTYCPTHDQCYYILETKRAVWVFPLCFTASPAHLTGYVVRFTYDDHDVVIRWEYARAEDERNFLWVYPSVAGQYAIEQLNRKGPTSAATLPTTQP